MSEERNNQWVSWKVFIWAIGLLTTFTLLGVSVSMSAKADVGDIKSEQGSIQTDIQWIKESVKRIENKL